MKAFALILAATLVAAPALAHNHAGDAVGDDHHKTDVHGLWLTEAGNATVRIGPCAEQPDTPCGIVASADIPEGEPTTDVNNRDESLRDQPIVGLTMLDGFQWSKSKWKRGRIYNPEDGKSYKSSIEVEPDAPNVLKVKGCIGPLCQTQRWTRVAE